MSDVLSGAPSAAPTTTVQPVAREPSKGQLRRRAGKLRRQLTKSVEGGDDDRARRRQRLYLTSYAVARTTVAQVSKEAPDHLKLNADQQEALAARINVYEPCAEPATLHVIPKPKGGTRTTFAFGTENRARQEIALAAMKPFALPLIGPNQYALKGTHACIEDIRTDLEQPDSKYQFTLDATDAFGSQEQAGQEIADLGILPLAVATNVLMARNVVVGRIVHHQSPQGGPAGAGSRSAQPANQRRSNPPQAEPDVYGSRDPGRGPLGDLVQCRNASIATTAGRGLPQGIPQGSATSPLVQEVAMSRILSKAKLPPGTKVWTYADDLYGTSRTGRDGVAAIKALVASARTASAGTLDLRITSKGRVSGRRHEFIGYSIKRVRGRVTVDPIERNLQHVKLLLRAGILRIQAGVASANELRNTIMGWCKAFDHADLSGYLFHLIGSAMRQFRHHVLVWTQLRRLLMEAITLRPPPHRRRPGSIINIML
jgi:hypothetical protein